MNTNIQNLKGGVYLVTEQACFNPTTGAFRHIHTGINELSKYYRINLVKGFKNFNTEAPTISAKPTPAARRSTSGLLGLFRDTKELLRNLAYLPVLLRQIRNTHSDFIYERAAYLNFNGLIISKLLGIPHFYEANGIQHEGRSVYYASWASPLAAWLERYSYSRSDFVFFVGSYGSYFRLSSANWKNIENGVEAAWINAFKELRKPSPSPKLNMCFIASLMAHQRPDLLVEAFKQITFAQSVRLHLIGANLSSIEKVLSDNIEVINHGFLKREELAVVMKDMHVGLVAGSPAFQSAMKLFDYACAGCVVIAPDVYNFTYWFSDTEIVFFESGNARSLSRQINTVVEHYEEMSSRGNLLHDRIVKDFTWEHIFSGVKNEIESTLNKNR